MTRNAKRSAFLATAVAALAAGATPARAQTPRAPLRVGTNPSDSYSEAYYAQDEAFFQRAGLTVDVQGFTGGAAAAAAVVAGALDISISTPLQLAQAVLRGVPFVIIAAGCLTNTSEPDDVLCVAKDAPFRTAKDLEGKAVALNTVKTAYQLALDAWLAKNDADPAKVTIAEVGFSAMTAMLQRGTVAAAFMTEPYVGSAVKAGTIRVMAHPMAAIADEYLTSCWFTTAQFARANPDVIKRFVGVIYESGRWANAHHDQSAVILAKYAKILPEAIGSMHRAHFAERLNVADVQPQLDAGAKFGFLARRIDASELIAKLD